MDSSVAVANNPRGKAKIHQPDSALTQRRQDRSPTSGWPSSERGGGMAAETRSGIAVINHWGLQQAEWGLSQTKMEDEPKSEGHSWWRCVCDAEAREGDSNGRGSIQQGNRPVLTWTSNTRRLLLFYLSSQQHIQMNMSPTDAAPIPSLTERWHHQNEGDKCVLFKPEGSTPLSGTVIFGWLPASHSDWDIF